MAALKSFRNAEAWIPACAGMTKLQPYCFDLPYFAAKTHGLSFIQKNGRLKSLRTQGFRRPFI